MAALEQKWGKLLLKKHPTPIPRSFEAKQNPMQMG